MQIPHPSSQSKKSVEVKSSSDKKKKSLEAQSKDGFQALFATQAKDIKSGVDALMLEIDEASQSLLKDPNEAHLVQYTNAIRHFIRKAQSQTFSVDKNFDKHNRLHILVREIDSQLGELTDQVLFQQKKSIALAARIHELRGILLDMYL